MATKKISALTELAVTPASGDKIPLVDISDTTDAVTGTTKYVTYTNLLSSVAAYSDATANFTGTLQNGGSNVVVDTDIGSTVQAYDAGLAYLDGLNFTDEATFKAGVNLEIGTDIQAYDSNLTSFVNTFTLPTSDSTSGYVLQTNGAGSIYFGQVTKLSSPVVTGTIREDVYSFTGTSITPSLGSIQYKTLSGNTTLTDGMTSGDAITLMINDGTSYTVTWPTMTWVNNGGSAPTLATTGYTVVVLWKVSTTLYGALVGDGT